MFWIIITDNKMLSYMFHLIMAIKKYHNILLTISKYTVIFLPNNRILLWGKCNGMNGTVGIRGTAKKNKSKNIIWENTNYTAILISI